MKKHLYTIVFTLLLLGFTTYMALDTFVLGRAYQGEATEMNLQMFDGTAARMADGARQEEQELTTSEPSPELVRESDAPVETTGPEAETSASTPETGFIAVDPGDGAVIGSYSDERMQITLLQYDQYDTVIYAADVQLTSAEYLKTAFALDTYGRNITQPTSQMAAEHGAILAINGDYYGTRLCDPKWHHLSGQRQERHGRAVRLCGRDFGGRGRRIGRCPGTS